MKKKNGGSVADMKNIINDKVWIGVRCIEWLEDEDKIER